jgi:CspA family cold shock protein
MVGRKKSKWPLVIGSVRWFSEEEGWGAIDASEAPGGVFVHHSAIDGEGYRTLDAGEQVEFELEAIDFDQDGFRYRAHHVRPLL